MIVGDLENIAMYDHRRVMVGKRAVIVVRTPCPQEPYGAYLEDDGGEKIDAWDVTPNDAIFVLMLNCVEKVAERNQHSQILDQLVSDELESWRD